MLVAYSAARMSAIFLLESFASWLSFGVEIAHCGGARERKRGYSSVRASMCDHNVLAQVKNRQVKNRQASSLTKCTRGRSKE